MEYKPNKSIFLSNEQYFLSLPTNGNEYITNDELKNMLDPNNTTDKLTLSKLTHSLKSENSRQSILAHGFTLIQNLLPLLLNSDREYQGYVYSALGLLADQLDHDELVENMMDQLICMSWEYNDEKQCLEKALLFSVYVELFGRGLEKMTKARDWMLFLPFLSNQCIRAIDTIETVLTEKSNYSSHVTKSDPSAWDQAVVLITGSCLDFIEFIHQKTTTKSPADFPISTHDVGQEDGDTKRRYLGYTLLNLIYDRVISNFDMQISKVYFEKHHTMYNIKRPHQQPLNSENSAYKPMFDMVHRCAHIAHYSGFTFERMYALLNSLIEKDHHDISIEDRLSDDDRQMINSRLYPLSYNGIAALISLSLYDHVVYPSLFDTCSIGLFPSNVDILPFAQKYIGVVLNLLTRSSELICQADKGAFVLLYLSDHIKTTVSVEDMEKYIQGPCGQELVFPAARIIEIISSVASTCPDPSIRFLSYKLVEKFLAFGDDETKVFFLTELLDRCPFPSMKTAAIGLLKDQINKSFNETQKKTFSIFTSPFIVSKFFPILFTFKSSWKDDSVFWDDYNYIVQALNIYFYLLLKDEGKNLTTVWNLEHLKSMKINYLQPLNDLIQNIKPNKDIHFQEMQIDIMKDVLEKIKMKTQSIYK
ncbi:unnamed protein product [Mucor hiemalis]